MFTRNLERAGAIGLAFGAAGFIVVFLYLRSAFGYPDILEPGGADVLPRLAAGGSKLRTAWLVYGALPLTLLVAGIASMPLLEDGGGRGLARLGAALRRSEQPTKGTFMLAAAAIVGTGVLRQFTSLVAPIAQMSNIVLPLALFAVSGFMFRRVPGTRGESIQSTA